MGYVMPLVRPVALASAAAFDVFLAALPEHARRRVSLSIIERGRAWVEVTTARGDRVTLIDNLESFPSPALKSRVEILL